MKKLQKRGGNGGFLDKLVVLAIPIIISLNSFRFLKTLSGLGGGGSSGGGGGPTNSPTISISPTTISSPGSITVTGTNFSPGGSVAFYAFLPSGALTYGPQYSTNYVDSGGNITMTVPISQDTINNLSQYPYIRCIVYDQPRSQYPVASNSVNVIFVSSGGGGSSGGMERMNYSQGGSGTVTVYGSGFIPNTNVYITFATSDGHFLTERPIMSDNNGNIPFSSFGGLPSGQQVGFSAQYLNGPYLLIYNGVGNTINVIVP